MADLPTRQFVIPPTPSPILPPGSPPPVPGLAPPQSWSDDEGTAALLLPEAGMLLTERPAPARPVSVAPVQPVARAAAVPGRGRANLIAGLVGGALAVVVVLAGGRLFSEPAGGPLTASQQVLVDEAMRAVADGQPERAADLLQRLRDSRPEASLEGLIAALKRQATGRGPASQPLRK